MRFEILPGFPAYGPPALSFDERGKLSEGLVVRFYPKQSEPWIGNFLGGLTKYSTVLDHPNGVDVVVVAQGDACVMDIEKRDIRHYLARHVDQVITVPSLGTVVFPNMTDFVAISANNAGWRSDRISWDGFRKIEIDGDELLGEAFSPISDRWAPFRLDLRTGRCVGSIYQEDMSTAVRLTPAQDAEAGATIWRIPFPKRPPT